MVLTSRDWTALRAWPKEDVIIDVLDESFDRPAALELDCTSSKRPLITYQNRSVGRVNDILFRTTLAGQVPHVHIPKQDLSALQTTRLFNKVEIGAMGQVIHVWPEAAEAAEVEGHFLCRLMMHDCFHFWFALRAQLFRLRERPLYQHGPWCNTFGGSIANERYFVGRELRALFVEQHVALALRVQDKRLFNDFHLLLRFLAGPGLDSTVQQEALPIRRIFNCPH